MNTNEIDAVAAYCRIPKHNNKCRLLPNLRAYDWWQCDIAKFTDAGFWEEIEVKHSYNSLRIDTEKGTWSKRDASGERRYILKKDLLLSGEENAPNKFWILMESENLSYLVPHYAGLIIKTGDEFEVRKEAPMLHRRTITDRQNTEATMHAYIQMHRYLQAMAMALK